MTKARRCKFFRAAHGASPARGAANGSTERAMTKAWRCKFFVPRTGQAPRAVPQMAARREQ
jgi:hypothetical protein